VVAPFANDEVVGCFFSVVGFLSNRHFSLPWVSSSRMRCLDCDRELEEGRVLGRGCKRSKTRFVRE